MAKKSLDKSIRKRILGKAWIRIEISDNARMAFIRGLYLGGDANLKPQHIIDTLHKEYGIVAGIDNEVVERILRQVSVEPDRTFSSKGDVIVAQAPAPIQARDGRVDFLFINEKLERNPLSYDSLRDAFAHKDPASVSRAGVRVRATFPGEKLAEMIPHRAGKPGQDIFGRIVTPVSARLPRRVHLSAGDHVREEEGAFYSEIFGYVCVVDEIISVIPPIWVSPDGAAGHYIHFPQTEPVCFPEITWLNRTLEILEINQEISAEKLAQLHQLIQERASGSAHFLLVQGVAPEPGQDGYLILNFEETGDKVAPDGSIDVLARKSALSVKSGDRIAEIVLPTLGKPGQTLNGKEIPAVSGKACSVKISDRVRVELEDDKPRFYYAKVDGNVSYNGNLLDVRGVLHIDGDVDNHTGNIETDQDVEIMGSVKKGFKVNAGGSVLIAGVIEDGASVTAKGDAVVAHGISGKGAKVVTLGNIETKSIDDSTVIARKDVLVGDHISNGQVRAGGRLVVHPGQGGGSGTIVGGEVSSAKGIEADQIGGEGEGSMTIVGISADLESETRLKKFEESINFCNSNILKIFRTLNIQTLNSQLIEDILRRTPPGRKKAIAELLVKLKELIVYRDESMSGHKALKEQVDDALKSATITVRDMAHVNAQIKIGQRSLTLKQPQTKVSFYLSDEGVLSRPMAS